MSMQLWKNVLTVVSINLGMGSLASATPRIHDYTSEFIQYWDGARALPPSEQVARFKNEVVPAFPEFYAFKFEKWRRAGLDVDSELARTLEQFPDLEFAFRERS